MHTTISLVLLVFAFVCACLVAFFGSLAEPNGRRLIAASLAFWYASILFGQFGQH